MLHEISLNSFIHRPYPIFVQKKRFLGHFFIILLIRILGVCAPPRKITLALQIFMLIFSSNTQGKLFLYHNFIPEVQGTS